MATKTLFKVGGNGGTGTWEIVDTDGTISVQVDGAQEAAITSLTDSSTGTAGDTVADAGATYTEATINNNFASLAAKIEAILDALRGAGIIAS